MLIIFFILLSIALVYFIGSIIVSIQFHKQVKLLFSSTQSISHKNFCYQQLVGLPEPVQRYFKHVLKNGEPYISYVSLTHDGTFKTKQNGKWLAINGTQYFTTQVPGFIWKGTTTMFTAIDMFIANKGKLVVRLFNLFKVANVIGNKVNEGELQRWVSESVWFPTNLLPSQHLQWLPIDANTATLAYQYNDIDFKYNVHFNTLGEIISMQTQRYFGETKRETWVINVANYKILNGIIIPTKATVTWKLASGNFKYANFNINSIHYKNPVLKNHTN